VKLHVVLALVMFLLASAIGLSGCESSDDGFTDPESAAWTAVMATADGDPDLVRLATPDDATAQLVYGQLSEALASASGVYIPDDGGITQVDDLTYRVRVTRDGDSDLVLQVQVARRGLFDWVVTGVKVVDDL